MKKVYVAGPYSASDARKVQANVNEAIRVGCELIKKGYAPFIPHLSHYIWIHPDGDFEYKVWTELDFVWLEGCDAFFYIGSSLGADKELQYARVLGIPIYRSLASVPDISNLVKK